MKVPFKPGTLIYPLPAVMVSCGDAPENYNILTIAWTGTICSDPPMCYISVRRERHSYDIIRRCGEFVINLTTEELARATDWCGVRSGRDWNKFKEIHLTPEKGQVVKAPLIAESPLNIECRVTEVKPLGSHDMFMAEVVAVDAEESLIDKGTGAFQLNHANPLAFSHGKYYGLGEKIGGFGFSVKKNKNKTK
ncbi:MAG: flavin reductase family protein [Bacteroidales bacterium]|nr:flavin reductase family protein [Bacteroidales bacterium]